MKKAFSILIIATLVLSLCACGSKSSSSSSSKKKSSSSSNYGFSDYLKDVDPDLYDSISDRYNSLK